MSRPTFIQAKKTTVYASFTSSETGEIVLRNLVDLYGNALAMSDFGSVIHLTFSPGTESEEIISATGFTVNADNTVSINAGIARGLKGVPPYGSGGTAKDHSAGTVVVVSNNPQMYEGILDYTVNLEDVQTIAGEKTFSEVPKTTAGNPVVDNDLARKAYVDSVVGGIATTSSIIVPGDAGENVSAGQLVYFDDTDNEWKLCDADTATTVENTLLGIAQGSGTNGNPITSGVLLRGLDANQTGLTTGALYYAGNTAGAIVSSAGTVEVTVGFAYSTTELYFNPRFNQQITEDQKDALAGTSGTPRASNKFVTHEGFQKNIGTYAADAGANDTYVITLSPAPTAYTTGMLIHFKANTANTGACTLNVNSLGAKSIVNRYNTNLFNNQIKSGQIVSVVYDGTNFQVISYLSRLYSVTSSASNIQASADTERTTTSSSYTKLKEIQISGFGGTIYTTFDIHADVSVGSDAYYGRIYLNGVATGTERTGTQNTYQTFTETITVVDGDLIQLYAKNSSGTDQTAVRNFRIGYTIAEATITEVVGLTVNTD
jgi:hypothetical protein